MADREADGWHRQLVVNNSDFVTIEHDRIQLEYRRREQETQSDLYAPWQPAYALISAQRRRAAAIMLHQAGIFPQVGDQCLEIGYGTLGWLGDLVSWGIRETDLHGIELDEKRAERAQATLPKADLRVGDATKLPWKSDTFRLVICSTVFTSILDQRVRRLVAEEIERVLAPGGALLWYDFAVNNPRNPHVRKVTRRELTQLFSTLKGSIQSVTLAPPVARLVASKSWVLATCLEAIPLLRTHLLAVLIKLSK